GLEEAEHDELASLIGRDAAALEVEELGLIDRSDRARMGGPAAVRLVDLERRDRDGPGLLRKVHPELAEEAVRPDRGRLDDDQALHVRPRGVHEGALREQVAGGVPPDVAGVRGQVEQLILGAKDDLDLLDGAAIAREAVVDAAADESPTELRERPVERRTVADLGVAVLERDRAQRQVLDARDPELGATREVDLEGAG